VNTIDDDYFGLLQWNTKDKEWQGTITLPPYEDVGSYLTSEYIDSTDVRKQIQETMKVIERDELSFRQRAANELFADRSYHFFVDENQEFDHNEFVSKMQLGAIVFGSPPPRVELLLGYEYGEGMEHGITISLPWDGVYESAQL
jgi:hypothetical protein